ncbi:MAG TPA: RuvA C-terminal domain-containing protein [Kofleriaceae bacterium]|nr:RuvA C-terminal domain-containing protein [Kofleriaceae bacterium]
MARADLGSVAKAIPSPHVGPALGAAPSNYGWIVMKTEAARALAQMGFTNQEARAVVEKAANDLPRDCSLERLMRLALRLTHR